MKVKSPTESPICYAELWIMDKTFFPRCGAHLEQQVKDFAITFPNNK